MRAKCFIFFALLILAACERTIFYTADIDLRENFYAHEEEYIALAKIFEAYPDIKTAQNCPSNICPYAEVLPFGRTLEEVIFADELFSPYLDRLGFSQYIFFKRGKVYIELVLNQSGGRKGDFKLDLDLVYWPEPDSTYVSCENYTPSNEDYYACFVPLKHDWMILRSGINIVKIERCSRAITVCYESAEDDCIPKECQIYNDQVVLPALPNP